jgi:hypothetical protein
MLQAPRAADPIHREAVKKGPRGKRSVRPAQKRARYKSNGKIRLIQGDSHDEETLKKVSDRKYDLLFIDARAQIIIPLGVL